MPDTQHIERLACNVCGCREFKPGFGGRLSSTGRPPACAGCGTLERHRLVRVIYALLQPISRKWRVLQFAPDKSVDPGWFGKFTPSVYGTASSLDMTNTGLPDGSYDAVISNHVLEHVPNYFSAIDECFRIVGKTGFVHFMVPAQSWDLDDWNFADVNKNEHYREFGADFGLSIARARDGLHVIGVIAGDPITSASDVVYFLSYSTDRLRAIHNLLPRKGIQVVRFS